MDCSCGDGAVEDVCALAVAGRDRSGVPESIDGPLDLVAASVVVAAGWPAARAASAAAGAHVVGVEGAMAEDHCLSHARRGPPEVLSSVRRILPLPGSSATTMAA